jgi:type II secretory pathway component PulF
MGIEISGITKHLLNMRSFCVSHTPLVTAKLLALVSAGFFIRYSEKSRTLRSWIVNTLPVVSGIKRKINISNFFINISLMLKENVNLLEALEIESEFESSAEISNDIIGIVNDIRNGQSLSAALRSRKMLSDREIAIITAGEKAGNLQTSFELASEFTTNSLHNKIEKIISMTQPIGTLLAGILLIIIVYSVLFPIYDKLSF